MSPKHALAALVVLLFAAPVAHAADPDFEGRIALRLRDSDPQGVDYAIRAGRARLDVPSVGGVHDLHVVVSLASADGAAPPGVEVQRTGHFRAVVGQRCEDWRLVEAGDVVEACVVAGAGWYNPRRVVGEAVPSWSLALERARAFPVSVTELRDGRVGFAMWATDVRREPVSERVFALPPRTSRR